MDRDKNINRNKNKNKNKKQVINIDRLEKATTNVEEESIGGENNIIEKTPFQKMVLYVYVVIILGLLLIGGYILYKYIFKKKISSNKVGGFSTKVDKIPEIDRKSISELLDKFID